jgi:hypothetical protein
LALSSRTPPHPGHRDAILAPLAITQTDRQHWGYRDGVSTNDRGRRAVAGTAIHLMFFDNDPMF